MFGIDSVYERDRHGLSVTVERTGSGDLHTQIFRFQSGTLVFDNKVPRGVSVVVAKVPRWVPDFHNSH